ncbi:Amine oxidase [Metarhizium rileyi]|uniref:Amine oxidase n=1 Tax=Metarhizium rileyi (strain RCEF 4871) TaxID=1649241 RepID=A0A166ZWY8_METRR|nr:Amine oxidase [Metarhizium rileyi RCEF 4871]
MRLPSEAAPTEGRQSQVAIVGTGLAGLATAHLLQNDKQKRFRITLFEQAGKLSFDAASVAVKNEQTGTTERIDLPMRACAGGYYANLLRMYDYLEIPLHPVRFLFVFARAAAAASQPRFLDASRPDDAGSAPGSYFVHASNLHQTPPPRPVSQGYMAHLAEVIYLVVCHFWFSVVCFFVPPITTASGPGSHSEVGETLQAYLERTWVPRRYISHYLLPLMSSVSTCSHEELLNFPASDAVNYKRLSHGQQHYAVCGGVHQVQDRLAQGIDDIRLNTRVTSVGRDGSRLLVRWQSSEDWHGHCDPCSTSFDHVVLAVSADVAARLYSPLTTALGKMPIARVESSVVSTNLGTYSIVRGSDADLTMGCAHHDGDRAPSQVITLRTQFSDCGQGSRTEALHTMPGGVLVSTCPLDPEADSERVLETARFTRTLRTPESRGVVRRIMRTHEAEHSERRHDMKIRQGDDGWVNGEDNVWLAGAWCWDGMVLLEGCVVSAMRVAQEFGVHIPWSGC